MTFTEGELISIVGEKSFGVYIEETKKANMYTHQYSMAKVFLVDYAEYREVYTDYLRKIDDTIST